MMQGSVAPAQHNATQTQRRTAQRRCQPACEAGEGCEREGEREFSHRFVRLDANSRANRRLPRSTYRACCQLLSGRHASGGRKRVGWGERRVVCAPESHCRCS
jgi:hypothetical protein